MTVDHWWNRDRRQRRRYAFRSWFNSVDLTHGSTSQSTKWRLMHKGEGDTKDNWVRNQWVDEQGRRRSKGPEGSIIPRLDDRGQHGLLYVNHSQRRDYYVREMRFPC